MLFGTTGSGGVNDDGTVFNINTAAVESVLYSFKGSDGAHPDGDLTVLDDLLYGTTYKGGTYARGTLFSVSTSGKEQVLHSFGAAGDGAYPFAGPLVHDGVLYGTATQGGAHGLGAAYESDVTGKESVIYSFGRGQGSAPFAGFMDLNGTLYGATASGGTQRLGTVFALSPKSNSDRDLDAELDLAIRVDLEHCGQGTRITLHHLKKAPLPTRKPGLAFADDHRIGVDERRRIFINVEVCGAACGENRI